MKVFLVDFSESNTYIYIYISYVHHAVHAPVVWTMFNFHPFTSDDDLNCPVHNVRWLETSRKLSRCAKSIWGRPWIRRWRCDWGEGEDECMSFSVSCCKEICASKSFGVRTLQSVPRILNSQFSSSPLRWFDATIHVSVCLGCFTAWRLKDVKILGWCQLMSVFVGCWQNLRVVWSLNWYYRSMLATGCF